MISSIRSAYVARGLSVQGSRRIQRREKIREEAIRDLTKYYSEKFRENLYLVFQVSDSK